MGYQVRSMIAIKLDIGNKSYLEAVPFPFQFSVMNCLETHSSVISSSQQKNMGHRKWVGLYLTSFLRWKWNNHMLNLTSHFDEMPWWKISFDLSLNFCSFFSKILKPLWNQQISSKSNDFLWNEMSNVFLEMLRIDCLSKFESCCTQNNCLKCHVSKTIAFQNTSKFQL